MTDDLSYAVQTPFIPCAAVAAPTSVDCAIPSPRCDMAYKVKLCGACPYDAVMSSLHDPGATYYACINCPVGAAERIPEAKKVYPRLPTRRGARPPRVVPIADRMEPLPP
jgi:hypothetical protein